IAVDTLDRDVDPVGACIGARGSRIQVVVNELRGEKIDVIRWSPDPATYIANALSPARVDEVRLMEPETRQTHVLVAEDQLSLAIGKEGQNVRLAARLTGWKIDIKDRAKYDYEGETTKFAAIAAQHQALAAEAEKVDEYEQVDEYEEVEEIDEAQTQAEQIEAAQNKLQTTLKYIQEFPSNLEAALKNLIEENTEAADNFRGLMIESSLSALRQLLERLSEMSQAFSTDVTISKLSSGLESGGVTVESLLPLLT
ncbi:MAG TPA: hypothetical protein V6D09_06075, partial [Leptolyngbyaceae cyanobacterium]